jgi:hypothetical protein
LASRGRDVVIAALPRTAELERQALIYELV